jgi:hypothetical protein
VWTPKLVTLADYAEERRVRAASMARMSRETGFPQPTLIFMGVAYFDREDIVRFLKATRPHHWIAKCC